MPSKIALLLLICCLLCCGTIAQNKINGNLDSLETLLNTVSGADKLVVLHELSTTLRTISIEKSRQYAGQALQLATVLNDKKASANALTQLSYIYLRLDHLDSSLLSAGKALKLYEEIGDKEGMADIKNRYAFIYIALGSYDKAMQYCLEALEIHRETGNKTHSERTLNNLGLISQGLKDYKKSLEYYQGALDYCSEVDNKPFTALVLNNIGIVYGELQDYENALVYFDQAFTTNYELGDLFLASSNLGNIGEAYRGMGNYNKAIDFLHRSIDIMGNETGNGLAIMNLGVVHTQLQEFDKASHYLTQALQLYSGGNSQYEAECYNSFSDLYKAQGNHIKALEFYQQYITLKDSIFDEESEKRLAMLQVAYETEKKEQQIIQQEEKLKIQKYWLTSLIFGLSGILIFFVIIYLQKTQLKKANKELVFKNLEIVESEKRAGPSTKQRNPKFAEEISKYTGSALDENQKEELFNSILYAMQIEKIFMQDNMTLRMLAEHLSTNTKYISQVINERINKNFSTFLNEYRVKEARRRLSDPANNKLTIEAIATEVGFQSISTFNKVFKKHTGITPSFFMKSMQEPL